MENLYLKNRKGTMETSDSPLIRFFGGWGWEENGEIEHVGYMVHIFANKKLYIFQTSVFVEIKIRQAPRNYFELNFREIS